MLRTITSHATRRQRQRSVRTRITSPSSSSSTNALPPHHGHHGIASSSITFPLSTSISCCLPCIDRADHQIGMLHSRRQLHSLSNHNHGRVSRASLRPCSSIMTSNATAAADHPIIITTTIQKRTKVFVSRHNNTLNLTPQSITQYVTAHLPHLNGNSTHPTHGDFRITNSHVVMKECPFCSKPTNGKADNFYKLYIAVGGGAYFCHRCGAKGSWYDFKSEIGGFAVVDSTSTSGSMVGNAGNAASNNGTSTMSSSSGGVSQPWNWNTSNNQGMSYLSTKQLITNQSGGNNQLHQHHHQAKQRVEPLPMPPAKLNSLYSAKLFDATTKSKSKEYAALEYLTQTRGLSRSVLRKFGVGCAPYNFPDKDASNGISYVSNMCVTFPWLMRSSEVAEQEELRGAEFVWKTTATAAAAGGGDGNKNGDNGKKMKEQKSSGRENVLDKNKKKPSEMTALERYHYRRGRKDRAKAAREDAAKAKQEQAALSNDDHLTSTANEQQSQQQQEVDQLLISSEEEALSLYGPYIPRRIKVRSITSKSNQRLDPPGGGFGLFGWHTVPHNATELIITEGEFDAMAVYQATGRPAVSLPNGCRSLPMEVLVLLERFDTIYLWMDNDGPGREGAEMFARKLGVERCLLVQPSGKRGWNDGGLNGNNNRMVKNEDGSDEDGDGEVRSALEAVEIDLLSAASDVVENKRPPHPPKDANEALLTGWDIHELLEEASELPHERILKFSDLRDQVIHEIVNPEKYRGAAIPSLPGFTSLIKGFRRGEMTVLTGPTGSGKTTFLGQTSLDLAEQGINVLWGSFEIKNTRLMHKLLQQYMKDVLPVGLADKDLPAEEKRKQMMALTALADKFDTLPMHFMKFHGGSDVDDVLDAMEYAAYVHDVEHIILDNMQFMISRQGNKGSSYDKFDMQDIAVEKFRKFATEYNVHVTLVVHPRKEDEGAKLGISSFFGSAKATQEADTVLILQSDGKRKFVDVKKNRFDGTLGHVPLYFQRKSGRYTETPEVTAPQRTSIPSGVSAMNGTRKQVNGSRASASSASVYQDIRGQHPIS